MIVNLDKKKAPNKPVKQADEPKVIMWFSPIHTPQNWTIQSKKGETNSGSISWTSTGNDCNTIYTCTVDFARVLNEVECRTNSGG